MPPQAAVEAGTRDFRIEELTHHREQLLKQRQQRLAQGDRHCLLDRRQRGLQPVRRVAPVMDAIALAPFPRRLFRDSLAFGDRPGRLRVRPDRGPDLRCRRRLLVQTDQHRPLLSQRSRRIDLAMNNAVRRPSMWSSGMGQLTQIAHKISDLTAKYATALTESWSIK